MQSVKGMLKYTRLIIVEKTSLVILWTRIGLLAMIGLDFMHEARGPHIPNSMNASRRWTEIRASAKNETAFDMIIDRVPCSVL